MEVASCLPSSLIKIVPILMMARLLDLSNYRQGTRNVPIPSPVQEAPRCQALHKCSMFSRLFETAYGLIIITKLEVGIDPCLFGNSNKFASPVSTREVVESKKTLAFMMPNVFARSSRPTSISRALVPLPVENLRQVGAATRPQDTRSSSRSSA